MSPEFGLGGEEVVTIEINATHPGGQFDAILMRLDHEKGFVGPIASAERAKQRAAKAEIGPIYPALEAQTFATLAVEAFCNAVGEQVIQKWKEDFDSASLMAKLRVLCGHLQLEFIEGSEPWSTIRRLVAFRNKVVHARPEPLETEEVMTREQYEKREFERPESKLEKQLTPGNAARAVEASQRVMEIILNGLTPDQRFALHEGCLGHTQVCDPPKK